jgi:hypothetical protein
MSRGRLLWTVWLIGLAALVLGTIEDVWRRNHDLVARQEVRGR